jgi:hypothetical protein
MSFSMSRVSAWNEGINPFHRHAQGKQIRLFFSSKQPRIITDRCYGDCAFVGFPNLSRRNPASSKALIRNKAKLTIVINAPNLNNCASSPSTSWWPWQWRRADSSYAQHKGRAMLRTGTWPRAPTAHSVAAGPSLVHLIRRIHSFIDLPRLLHL